METKTYFSNSIHAAMEVARKELSPEALLIGSRPAPADARNFGPLEVTFAWEGRAKAPPGYGAPRQPLARPGVNGFEDLRLEISALRAAIARQPPGRAGAPETPPVDTGAVDALCETGFPADTARTLAEAAAAGTGRAEDGMQRELAARIPVAPFRPLEGEETRTMAFVGPAGRGKTTSLIKIAIRYGIARQTPVRIYSAGAHGVGAAEQMGRYASILGTPFQAVESFGALGLALQGERWKGLVLIDTPGFGAEDRQDLDAMAKFFARRGDIERHLVLRAEARSADMQHVLSRFAPVGIGRLLFTGLDEAAGLGAAADTMIRSGIAAGFFSTGTRIPEDLEEADGEKLVRSLWPGKGLAARAA